MRGRHVSPEVPPIANNYVEFSQVFQHLTEEEAAWLAHELEIVYVFDGHEFIERDLPAGTDPTGAEWSGCRAWRDLPDYDPAECEVGFAFEFAQDDEWGRYLWFHADECGAVERVAHLVQKFLKQFRPDECWSLTWAVVCSKPRVGEFGGGAVFVTAEAVHWQDSDTFIEQQQATFSKGRPPASVRVVLDVSGGLVQDVFCSEPGAEVIVLDRGTEDADADDEGVVEITDSLGQPRRISVTRVEVRPLDELARTEAGLALEKAGLTGGPP